MPRAFLLSLAALSTVVMLASCSTDEPTAAARDSTALALQSLQEENAALRAEQQDREVEIREKTVQVQATTRLIHKILDDLAALAVRKDLVRGIRVAPPAQLAADFPQNEQAVRAAESLFTRHLSLIESNLEDSQEQIDRVRNGDRIEPETVADLNARIDGLRDSLRLRDSRRATLQATADSLAARLVSQTRSIHRLRRDTASLHRRIEAQQRAYVAVGTADALEQRGILDQRFLRRDRIERLQPRNFDSVSATTERIAFPDAARDASVLSLHRKAPELYTIDAGTLRIHDPDAFWARSRFLIVKIDT